MKNNISGPPHEINNVEEKKSYGDKLDNIISLEEAGSVDGATPEVVSSEEDNTEGYTQNSNGASGWTPFELEELRRCRNRAYTKVNNKRRQHLQASLSTYLQIEWHKQFPDSKLTGRTLLQAYVGHFKSDDNCHDSNAVHNVRGTGTRGGKRGGRGGRRGRVGFKRGGNNRLQRQEIMAIKKLESNTEDNTSISPPQIKRGAIRRGRGRGRGRGRFATSLKRKRGGLSAGSRSSSLETHNVIRAIPDEDHSDRLWSDSMLSNLLHCGKVAEERLKKKNLGINTTGQDFVEILFQEWKKIYPNSTMNSRNIKSRLSVYKKTCGDFPHPTKRRKLDQPSTISQEDDKSTKIKLEPNEIESSDEVNSSSISLKEHFSLILDKKADESNSKLSDKPLNQITTDVKVEPIIEKENAELQEEDANSIIIKSQTAGLVDEVSDEFVPENANNSSQSSIDVPNKSTSLSDTTSHSQTLPEEVITALETNIDMEKTNTEGDSSSRSSPNNLSRRVSLEQACPKHWCHVFHDRDKDVECVLTQQLLDIRKTLEPQFPGCDIYSPRKPKGFSASVLDQWKKYYPHSEESVKTIAHKLSKFDRGPDPDLDANGVKITPKGRVMWSQIMLNNLQEAKKIATDKCKPGESIGVAWKEEWNKMYPDLKVEWRTVISRYNYHFGGIDEQENSIASRESPSDFSRETSVESNLKFGFSSDAEQKENIATPNGTLPIKSVDFEKNNTEEYQEVTNEEPNNRSKVKGFRNWTTKTKSELVETKNKIVKDHPNLEPGSTEFNHLLLREFMKLNPKCMESSRSIYSKLQSIEKETGASNDNCLRSSDYHETEVPKQISNIADIRSQKENISADIDEAKSKHPNSMKSENTTTPNNVKSIDAGIDSNLDEDAQEPVFENSTIEGFQDWSLGMIRDFISCMDTARRRHAELRENQPNEQVKMVPLLLEEWRSMYPNSTETVKTFLVRIKHIKLQKDVIKKHLVGSNTNENNDDDHGFKWHRDMIQDVIDSRRRALEIKDKALEEGKKLSFHALWASEFKRVYPNSTFTSNNLSVHFWTWRKQQLKKKRISKKTIEISEAQTSDTLKDSNHDDFDSSKETKVYNAPGPWSKLYKRQLLEVGQKVEKMLQEKRTPNEIKLKGFANILHEEWQKLQRATNGTKQDVSARAINMMYSRLLRENGPSTYSINTSYKNPQISYSQSDQLDDFDSKITATWTPKHNRVLRECMEGKMEDKTDEGEPISHAVFTNRIIRNWRKKFPKSSISDDDLSRRISDSMFNIETAFALSDTRNTTEIGNDLDSRNNSRREKTVMEAPLVNLKSEDDTYLLSDSNNKLLWNIKSITVLFDAHFEAKAVLKTHRLSSKNVSNALSFLVHKNFVKQYPHCKLSAASLLAKYYKLLEEPEGKRIFGSLSEQKSITVTDNCKTEEKHQNENNLESFQERHSNDNTPSGLNLNMTNGTLSKKQKGSRDLVFRTWTQEMIDDMLYTRKIAISKKKKRAEKNPSDPITITDLWYDEFLKFHPDYKSTKKNLWRKYKWYTTRIKSDSISQEVVKHHNSGISSLDYYKSKDNESKNNISNERFKKEFDMSKAVKVEIENEPVKLKPIKQDVYDFIKDVLEESRIFLPKKLPEESFLKHSSFEKSGTSEFPSNLNVPNLQCLELNETPTSGNSKIKLQKMFAPSHSLMNSVTKLPSSVTVTPQVTEPNAELDHTGNKGGSSKRSSIKLPGGATLVAVTDRNADLLLKPKQMEKPHVTITIGEKGDKTERRNSTSSVNSDGGNVVASVEEIQPPNSFVTTINGIPSMSKSPGPISENYANKQAMQQTSITAILQTPNQTIPLRIPFPINVPQYTPTRSVSLVAPPPLPQLKPFTNFSHQQNSQCQLQETQKDITQTYPRAIIIPAKLKCHMAELGLNEKMFIDLLREYEVCRDLYINTLKRGYLMFFPYLLGSNWREKYPAFPIQGRELVSLIDMYIEEKRRTKVAPEYLTKVPCNFIVTETILKNIQMCHHEAAQKLQKSAFDRFKKGENSSIEPAHIYVEMCKRWLKIHPDIRMTTKQLISIHRMLDFEGTSMSSNIGISSSEPSPEIICHMADIWKLLDKEISDQQIIVDVEDENSEEDPLFEEECLEMERELNNKFIKIEPHDDDCFEILDSGLDSDENLSMEQLQEWNNATHYITSKVSKVKSTRPRYTIKNPRLYWSNHRVEDLLACRKFAIQHFKTQKKKISMNKNCQIDILFNAYKKLHKNTKLSKFQIAGKCIRNIRNQKRRQFKKDAKVIKNWKVLCSTFLENEENIKVTNEELDATLKIDGQVMPLKGEMELTEDDDRLLAANELNSNIEQLNTAGLGGFRLTNLNQNLGNLKLNDGNPNNLNFNRDQDVLAYIKETQNLTGKGNHGVTWTADVIADLVHARSEARRRKREWEIWATKKYGGIGIAYNNPNIHYKKVDEMFKEEWSKLRPDLSSLSVWTLVSYARKYDALKKQLIVDNGQVEETGEQKIPRFGYRRDVTSNNTNSSGSIAPTKAVVSLPSFSTVFYPDSGLPKYDLELLEKLEGVTQEFKDLIRTRQLAKERQISCCSSEPSIHNEGIFKGPPLDSQASLLYLWRQEWIKHKPECKSLANGNLLLKRLWTLFRVGSNWTRTRPALLRQATDLNRKEYSFKPNIQGDEILHIRPRRPVFPEDEWQELIHDEDMAPHSNGNTVLLWSNVIPNPMLKRAKKLSTDTIDNKESNKAPGGQLHGQDSDSAFKPPPQKHTLINYDRELFKQMSLDLEVPILEVALDNNAIADGYESDITTPQNVRKSRAYNILEQHNPRETSHGIQYQPKPIEIAKDSYYCVDSKKQWSNVNNYLYTTKHHF